MDYEGVIIEESLDDKSVLKRLTIKKTEVEKVTKSFGTPWLKQWTLHTVIVPEKEADRIAREIGAALSEAHSSHWYADFKNDKIAYIIFKHRIFKIDRRDQIQHDEARAYGISLGIPPHQVDFKALASK